MSNEVADLRAHITQAASHETLAGIDFVRLPGRDRTRILETEDRYFGAQWDLSNGLWKLAVVLDGHGTSVTVDFVLNALPSIVQAALVSAVEESNSQPLGDDTVSKILSQALIGLDERIKNEFIALLPPDIDALSDFDATVPLRDPHGKPRIEVDRALSGTTATVALIDPLNRIHVASVGDCDAVLCVEIEDGWDCQDMGFHHQCSNPAEMARIRAEHPGEPNCVTNTHVGRLLGGMPLSRGIGDMHFKLPVNLVRILEAGCGESIGKAFIDNNITPPYMSNIPEIGHANVPGQKFLIIASDGLDHLMRRFRRKNIPTREHGKIYAAAAARAPAGQNLAAEVLWEAFGGDGEGNIYGDAIAGKLQGRVDDITIAVVPL
ncbi:phosphatase 2C-like domain-containing protein [Mycena pura]|uniref:Phosphatase 2C-like domain-containing protein n=1 Tax=Mycena pura TaxID=153505 RepID=A0AAD6UZI5_9AGAR|nr:phosphatase 2C-like domain-containing protein [Mycena pura]